MFQSQMTSLLGECDYSSSTEDPDFEPLILHALVNKVRGAPKARNSIYLLKHLVRKGNLIKRK